MLTQEQASAYLDRIGFEGEVRVDEPTLSAITFAHQCAVPFETVSIYRSNVGAVPALDVAALYDKVVTQRLGGYCFELNKLFEELLRALGFDARPCLCRAVRGREARMPINHRGVGVALDGVFCFVDVGFGGPMAAGALALLDGEEQIVEGERYTPQLGEDGWWRIDRQTRSALDLFDDGAPARRQTELEVCEAAVEDIDFNALNVAFSLPGTLFRDHMVVNLRTRRGHYALMDHKLTVREDGCKRVEEIADDAQLAEVLRTYFGMVF